MSIADNVTTTLRLMTARPTALCLTLFGVRAFRFRLHLRQRSADTAKGRIGGRTTGLWHDQPLRARCALNQPAKMTTDGNQ